MAESYSKWVENSVGKGEIAHYEQFLLFPQCFQKACFPGASKAVVLWEWIKSIKKNGIWFFFYADNIVRKGKSSPNNSMFLTLYHTIPTFNSLQK